MVLFMIYFTVIHLFYMSLLSCLRLTSSVYGWHLLIKRKWWLKDCGNSKVYKKGESMMRLDNKVAIITGSASGIGKGIALAMAKEGAHVDRKSTRLNSSHV